MNTMRAWVWRDRGDGSGYWTRDEIDVGAGFNGAYVVPQRRKPNWDGPTVTDWRCTRNSA